MNETAAAELVELARAFRSSGWTDATRRRFIRAARAQGYVGNVGGWIYRDQRCVTQGWQSLAMMLTGDAGKHVTSQAR